MTRWRRVRGRVLLLALLLLVPVAGVLLAGTAGDGDPLDPASAQPEGARAVAEVLRDQGVRVTRVERVSAARRALAAGPATLAVTGSEVLEPGRLGELAAAAPVVVLLAPDAGAVAAVTPALVADAPESPVSGPVPDPVAAGCDDPDARAAGRALPGGTHLRSSGDGGRATTCFDGSYAVAAAGGRTVRVLGQGAVATNEHLDEAGDAALALRALGSQARLVWLVASPLDGAAAEQDPSVSDLLPRWVRAVAVQLLLAGAAAVVWRSRRLGALVTEPLPVVVRSVETAQGRAALYRASGDRAAAARALRAAARWRLAARLGLPPAAPAEQVVALAAASSGRDPAAVSDLLTGPAPRDDAALAALADALDDLAPDPSPDPSRPTPADLVPVPPPSRRGSP